MALGNPKAGLKLNYVTETLDLHLPFSKLSMVDVAWLYVIYVLTFESTQTYQNSVLQPYSTNADADVGACMNNFIHHEFPPCPQDHERNCARIVSTVC